MPSRPPKPISKIFSSPRGNHKYQIIMDWAGMLFSPEDFGEYEARDWMECVDSGSMPSHINFYCTSADSMHKVRTAFQSIGRKTGRKIKTQKLSAKELRIDYI